MKGAMVTDHIYLAHHGIKGMKWGVRRFRNKDGTLTEAGKNRYKTDLDRGYRDNSGSLTKEGLARSAVVSKNSGQAISGTQNIVRGVRTIYDTANAQPRNRYNKRPTLTQEEMDKMSDKELRDLVNRLNLEQQYSQLTQDSTSRGRIRTGLDYAESMLSIAGGALSVYAAWRMLSNN